MTVMEFINAHREDMDPCECVILPDGSVEEPQPSHIKKLEEISGEDKLTLNSRMEKNMEPIFFMVEYTGCFLDRKGMEWQHGWRRAESQLRYRADWAGSAAHGFRSL